MTRKKSAKTKKNNKKGNIMKDISGDTKKQLVNDAIKLTAIEFSAWVLDGKTYEIDYSGDPPWDSSGRLVEQESSEAERLHKYKTLGQWMEDCYTGQTTASYVSGCGLFHDSYSKQIEDEIGRLAEDFLIRERKIDKNDEVAVDLTVEDAISLQIEIIEAVTKIDTDLAWEIGRFLTNTVQD
jgi:hypothetical protein